jgi:hypothetical protein
MRPHSLEISRPVKGGENVVHGSERQFYFETADRFPFIRLIAELAFRATA